MKELIEKIILGSIMILGILILLWLTGFILESNYQETIKRYPQEYAMITALKVFVAGESKDYVVGKGGVKKIFYTKEDINTIIILTEDNIVEYHGIPFVIQKDYKEVK